MATFVKIAILLCIYFADITIASSCPPSKCPKRGHTVVAVLSDSAKYMDCTNGIGIIQYCPKGEYFSYEDKVCSPNSAPGPVVCEEIDSKEDSAEESPKDESAEKTIQENLAFENNVSQRCIDNSKTPFTCPNELPEDSLFPHPDDTHLFYYCVAPGEPPICRECPDDLHFNTDKNVCDFKSNKYENLHQLVGPSGDKRNESLAGTACETKKGLYADLRPNPENCGSYYVCDWGQIITMHCPAGLHFNALLNVCDSPAKANCRESILNYIK